MGGHAGTGTGGTVDADFSGVADGSFGQAGRIELPPGWLHCVQVSSASWAERSLRCKLLGGAFPNDDGKIPEDSCNACKAAGIILLSIVAVPCLLVAGLLAWRMEGKVAASPATQSIEHGEESAKSSSPRQEVRVDVVTPGQHGLGRKTVQPGTVHAFEYAELYAKTSGYLGEQNVDIGDRVMRGQVLARIEVPELKAGVDEAQASLTRANSAQAQTEARLLTQRRGEGRARYDQAGRSRGHPRQGPDRLSQEPVRAHQGAGGFAIGGKEA